MVAHAARHADAAGVGERFEARGYVDAIAEDVAVLHHDVADIDADAELHSAFRHLAFTGGSDLLLDFHRAICGDLIPDWAGRFRSGEVKVGQHSPPLHHQVPLLVRDYTGNLQARLTALSAGDESLLLETLAFAEGRLLFIHPFTDFNGRATRLWLAEILRREELPPVELVPTDEAARPRYLRALQAADRLDWSPLIALWQERLANA